METPITPTIKEKKKPSKSIHRGGQLRLDDDVIKLWKGRRKELEFKLRLDALTRNDPAQLNELAQDLRDLRTLLRSSTWPLQTSHFTTAIKVVNRLLGVTKKSVKTK